MLAHEPISGTLDHISGMPMELTDAEHFSIARIL
jgi:hypothetical protein